MSSFEEMLSSIRSGKVIPLNRLLRKCPDGLTSRSILDVFVHDGTNITGIADPDGFDALCAHYGRPFDGATRLTAARTGRSHRISVSSGMLAIRSSGHPHPVVVLVSESGDAEAPRELAPNVLIVENLENFLAFEKTVEFCHRFCGLTTPIDELEVIYGAGAQISNKHYRPFLGKFAKLWVLPDADAGGLDICKKLAVGLEGLVEPMIMAPNDLVQRLSAQGQPFDESERGRLLQLTDSTPAIRDIAQLLLQVGKKLEQETYLLEEEI